jgi:hypothetical protein
MQKYNFWTQIPSDNYGRYNAWNEGLNPIYAPYFIVALLLLVLTLHMYCVVRYLNDNVDDSTDPLPHYSADELDYVAPPAYPALIGDSIAMQRLGVLPLSGLTAQPENDTRGS